MVELESLELKSLRPYLMGCKPKVFKHARKPWSEFNHAMIDFEIVPSDDYLVPEVQKMEIPEVHKKGIDFEVRFKELDIVLSHLQRVNDTGEWSPGTRSLVTHLFDFSHPQRVHDIGDLSTDIVESAIHSGRFGMHLSDFSHPQRDYSRCAIEPDGWKASMGLAGKLLEIPSQAWELESDAVTKSCVKMDQKVVRDMTVEDIDVIYATTVEDMDIIYATLKRGGMIEVSGKIHNQAIIILIDSGATHSYINFDLVDLASLNRSQHENSWSVQLANGAKTTISEVVQECPIDMNGFITKADLNIIHLGSYDCIIGMDWLDNHRAVLDCYNKAFTCIDEAGELRLVKGIPQLSQLFHSGAGES